MASYPSKSDWISTQDQGFFSKINYEKREGYYTTQPSAWSLVIKVTKKLKHAD
jgi:hypothetical protein